MNSEWVKNRLFTVGSLHLTEAMNEQTRETNSANKNCII